MKQLKRIISLCLVVALLAVYTPSTVQAEGTVSVDGGACGEDLRWNIDEGGTLTISGSGNMSFSSVPWRDYRSKITKVVIEDGVTTVGYSAFSGCDNLVEVTIPESVTTIEASAFEYCESLTYISIPNGVVSVGNNAFYGCYELSYVTIPASVTNIGKRAFVDNVEATSLAECPRTIRFYGDAPIISSDILDNTIAVLQYPADNPTWTADVMHNYGGTVTWIPCASDDAVVASGKSEDGLNWKITGNGVLTISGVGEMRDYFWDSMPWNIYRGSIFSVEIEEGVTSIGSDAFIHCTNLRSITIPDGVNRIGSRAFGFCRSLESITIPASTTDIDASFGGCRKLKAFWVDENNLYYSSDSKGVLLNKEKTEIIQVPKGIEGSYTVPEGVTCIDDSMFAECVNLTEVSIPSSVIDIGEFAFDGCSNLTNILIGTGVEKIGRYAFRECAKLMQVAIPQGVTSIEESTFWSCDSLVSVDIPSSVTSIGDFAFCYCTSLVNVDMPEGVTYIGERAFANCKSLTSMIIPASVAVIENEAFAVCDSLGSVIIKEGVVTIGEDSFRDCNSLAAIVIPSSVIDIGSYAFARCGNLTALTIQEGVTSIGEGAFAACVLLESIGIPASVINIGKDAFVNCSSADGFWVDKANACYSNDDAGVLFNKDKTELLQAPKTISGKYTVPKGVISISEDAFYGCDKLTDIVISEGVNSIGAYAFYGCDKLTDIVIPEGVISIGQYAFHGCKSLSRVVLPSSLTSISDWTFIACENLTNVIIPEGVTSIGSDAFYGCNNLNRIVLPSSLTSISNRAFNDCINLTEIYFAGDAVSFGSGVFSGNYGNFVVACAYYPAENETWTKEIMLDYGGDITWIPYYEIHQGVDSVLNVGRNETLTVRISDELTNLESISVDGVTVDAACYTVSEGITIVTFHTDYLKTLTSGEHTVSVHFSNGVVAATKMKILASVGDVDEDGEVSDWDAIVLNRYLAGWNVEITQVSVDVDGDGEVSDWDAIVLERYLAGWNVKLGG